MTLTTTNGQDGEGATERVAAGLKRRRRSELILKSLGLGAILVAFAMLVTLVGSLVLMLQPPAPPAVRTETSPSLMM